MNISKIILFREARQFEDDNPTGKPTAHKWVVIFKTGGVYYQTDMPTTNQPTQMPSQSLVQKHINEKPNSVKPSIALSDPKKGTGFTFQ
ncbi:MAG TPA: hypothetical protein VG347_19075 [Verrucomicrobiae bacterium]|nr:hypothetical protein [Verrucomicrobiae bacterium]